jgi:hypothetical protein
MYSIKGNAEACRLDEMKCRGITGNAEACRLDERKCRGIMGNAETYKEK